MIAVVCLDENNGMLFNNRRQSRDEKIIEDIISHSDGNKILITSFSESLFKNYEGAVSVSDSSFNNAGENDICFIESIDFEKIRSRINKLIIYRWNRVYPADVTFDPSHFRLIETTEFIGSSHNSIKKEIYSL
ncbi:MAG: ribonuclease Z [Clostridia bacterium]|nr:ribonuclease Z [Clostridia bacterium]